VERFAPGPEVAVEGLVVAGELRPLAVFDKPDPLDGPAFEETIYVTPSRLASRDLDAALAAVAAAVAALGLVDGPIHAEVRVHDGRAVVIEVAARTIGGLCARALSFSTGRSLEELVIAHALGLALGETDAVGASGVLMVPIPRAGTLVEVAGQAEAQAVPGITDIQITIAPGRVVTPVPEGNRYLGFVFARDSTPARVERALRRAWACLDVRIAPDGEGAPTPTP
jgi:biotin carboxylase